MGKAIKLALILAVFCAISSGLLAWVYLQTQPKIEQNAKMSFENSLKEVLPGADQFKKIKKGVFAGQKNSKILGFVVAQSPRGYGGPIEMLVGMDPAGKVVGIKVLNMRETPGLGNNITKNSFLKQFIGKTIKDELEPEKDIDAITGATISSRGVCNGVKGALKEHVTVK